jgi:hypothetical protein
MIQIKIRSAQGIGWVKTYASSWVVRRTLGYSIKIDVCKFVDEVLTDEECIHSS